MTPPAGQRWTRSTPTEPGWYWFKARDEDGESCEIVQAHISEMDGNMYFCFTCDEAVYEERDMIGEFQGPLTPNEATE